MSRAPFVLLLSPGARPLMAPLCITPVFPATLFFLSALIFIFLIPIVVIGHIRRVTVSVAVLSRLFPLRGSAALTKARELYPES